MKNLNVGSIVVVAAVVIAALVILGFIGTLLSNIVPLTIVAVIAFILGRTSHTVNYVEMAGNLLKRSSVQIQSARTSSAKPAAATTKPAEVEAPKKAETPAPPVNTERQKQAETNLADEQPEIKTEQEVLAAARLREEEIRKGSTAYDPTAALEERRKRLLGDKAEGE